MFDASNLKWGVPKAEFFKREARNRERQIVLNGWLHMMLDGIADSHV